MPRLKGAFRHLASIKLAVFVILGLAVVSGVGTIIEARFDSEVAKQLVYNSIYMYIVLGCLCANLIAVMVDRWPWQAHHSGFVLAHVGILILLLGSWVTSRHGIDGSMAFEIGQTQDQVTVTERDLMVYSSFDGNTFQKLFEAPVNFLTHPPSRNKPYIAQLGNDEIKVIGYEHFAFRESQIAASDEEMDGPAIRFQLANDRVSQDQWLRIRRGGSGEEVDLGLARFRLVNEWQRPTNPNEIQFRVSKAYKLEYRLFNKSGKVANSGELQEGSALGTGWMGLEMRLIRFFPHAREIVKYQTSPSASPASVSAIQFEFRGKTHWLGLNSVLRFYLEDRVYVVSYGNRRLQLAFPLRLKEFRMGKYQGTDRPSSYESQVEVPGRGEVVISMNEPLKHEGFTFYQSSFEKNQAGEPVVSVLSVNHDPGRGLKYLGSGLIVLGSILLFYFKRSRLFAWGKKS